MKLATVVLLTSASAVTRQEVEAIQNNVDQILEGKEECKKLFGSYPKVSRTIQLIDTREKHFCVLDNNSVVELQCDSLNAFKFCKQTPVPEYYFENRRLASCIARDAMQKLSSGPQTEAVMKASSLAVVSSQCKSWVAKLPQRTPSKDKTILRNLLLGPFAAHSLEECQSAEIQVIRNQVKDRNPQLGERLKSFKFPTAAEMMSVCEKELQ